MKPKEAGLDDIEEIFQLYQEILSPNVESPSWQTVTPAKVHETLQRATAGDSAAESSVTSGYRLGSKWGDDKLAFELGTSLTVRVLTNIQDWHPDFEEATAAHRQFREAANEYLG